MELNEFEREMLDALLDAFGTQDVLTRAQLLDLFGLDEGFAVSLVRILLSEGLVTGTGISTDLELPGQLLIQPKGRAFLKNGGFAKLPVETETDAKKPVWNEEFLQKKNTELQNETLKLQRSIRERDDEIRELNARINGPDKWKIAFYVASAFVLILLCWIIFHWPHHHVVKK